MDSLDDGYLALRTEPSSERGARVTTMPHRASVAVLGSCVYPDEIGGRSGYWGRVGYGGYEGWAFSGYLITAP